MVRAQFSPEQRTKLMLDYSNLSVLKKNFWPELNQRYMEAFPMSRLPAKNTVRNLMKKQLSKFTMHNCNSKDSPGNTHSGRTRTVVTERNKRRVKRIMDRDSAKNLGRIGRDQSPINSGRRNKLGISQTSWRRISAELKYHPYKAVRRQRLLDTDLPRRINFCNWVSRQRVREMKNILFSDEACFDLKGHVNSQNVRMYAEVGKGRPENLAHENFVSEKLLVFCGIKASGLFGLKFYRNETMNAAKYKSLLQYHVLPEVRANNGGNLDNLTWTQDGAPCHTERRNIAYLHRQFDGRLISKGAEREWPPRSPDLNPCDFFLWGYLKSRVYYPKPNNLDELQAAIQREVRQMDPDMCRRAVLDIRKRADLCLNNDGKCFET